MSDKYFRHVENGTVNVVYIPADWPVETEDDDFMGYLYGYGPTRLQSNDDEVETLWFNPERLTDEITEEEARRIHPALFEHLERINAGLV
jgi:hypothetical protein